MIFKLELLLLISSIVFILLLIANFLKRKYTLFQFLILSIFFWNIVLFIGNAFFPLEFGHTASHIELYLIPFSGLKLSDISYILKLIVLTLPFGICIPLLTSSEKKLFRLLVVYIFLVISEVARYIMAKNFIFHLKIFDTGILAVYAAGMTVGYCCYLLYNKIINNKINHEVINE